MKAVNNTILSPDIGDQYPFIRPSVPAAVPPQPVGIETEELLSIVVPFYNMGEYIGETIASLRAIDYRPREIIIVNDGSNDRTSIEKLKDYRNAGDIRVLDTENKGLAHARNHGARSAKGRFLAFLDADDTVSGDYYSKAVRVLRHCQNVYFVGAWTQYFEGSQKIWPTFTPEPPLILYHNLVNSSALVYKRNAFLAAGTNDTEMAFKGLEDYDSVLGMVEAGLNGVVLPEPLFHYRVRGNSMIRQISRPKKLYLLEYI